MANTQVQYTIGFKADTSQAKAGLKELESTLKKISTMHLDSFMDNASLKSAAKAAQDLQAHLHKATNVETGKLNLNAFNASLLKANQSVSSLADDLLNAGSAGTQAFTQLARSISMAEVPIKKVNSTLASIGTTLKNTIKWELSSSFIHGIERTFSNAVGYVKNLNSSLNDIRIVTGASVDDMAKFAEQANRAAKALSTTTKAYTDASLIYYQQGDSQELAAKKAALTIKAANASFGSSTKEMSEYLTAVWNSYQVGANELEHYVDIMAALGAKTATSLEEIATSMQKVAATSNTVGVSMEQVSSIISTVSSVTRESAESIGTSYKTIFARIGDLKLGKADEDGIGLGQVSSALESIGVKVLDAQGNLRDMGLIIEDLGTKWQGMSEAQKTATAQVVAGKRQYTQLMALFENWDMYKTNMSIAQNAEGSLQKMQDTYAESWEAASQRVTAALEKVYSSLLNDQAMVKTMKVVEKLVEGFGGLIDGLGGLPGILLTVGGALTTTFAPEIAARVTELGIKIKDIFSGSTEQSKFLEINAQMRNELAALARDSAVLGDGNQTQLTGLFNISAAKDQLLQSSKNLSQAQIAEVESAINAYQQEIEKIAELQSSMDKLAQERQAGKANLQSAIIKDDVDFLAKNKKNQRRHGEGAVAYRDRLLKAADKRTLSDVSDIVITPTINDESLKKFAETTKRTIEDVKSQFSSIGGIFTEVFTDTPKTVSDLLNKTETFVGSIANASNLGQYLNKVFVDTGSALYNSSASTEEIKKDLEASVTQAQKLATNLKGSFKEETKTLMAQVMAPSFNLDTKEAKDKVKELATLMNEDLSTMTEMAQIKAEALKNAIAKIVPPEAQGQFEALWASFAKGDISMQELQKRAEQLGVNFKKFIEETTKGTETLPQKLTRISGGLMSLTSAINSVTRAFDTLTNPDTTALEKTTAILGALTSVIYFANSGLSQMAGKWILTGIASAKAGALTAKAGALASASWAPLLIGVIAITAAVFALIGAIKLIGMAVKHFQRFDESLKNTKKSIEENDTAIKKLSTDMQKLSNVMSDTSLTYDEQLSKINEITSAYGVQASMLEVLSGNYAGLEERMKMAAIGQANLHIDNANANLNNTKDALVGKEQQDELFGDVGTSIGLAIIAGILTAVSGGAFVIAAGVAAAVGGSAYAFSNGRANQHTVSNYNNKLEESQQSSLIDQDKAIEKGFSADEPLKIDDIIYFEEDFKKELYSEEAKALQALTFELDKLGYEIGNTGEIVAQRGKSDEELDEAGLLKLLMNDDQLTSLGLDSSTYTGGLIQSLIADGYGQLLDAERQKEEAKLMERLYSSDQFDLFQVGEQENYSIEQISELIKDVVGKNGSYEDKMLIAKELSKYEHYGDANKYMAAGSIAESAVKTWGYDGSQEMITKINAKIPKDGVQLTTQEDLTKYVHNWLMDQLNEAEGVTVDVLMKISPSDITWTENGEMTFKEKALELAQAQVAVDKAQARQNKLKEAENVASKEAFSKDDYTTLWTTGLFETNEELTAFMKQSASARQAQWNVMMEASIAEEQQALDDAIAANEQRQAALAIEINAWMKSMAEKPLSDAVASDLQEAGIDFEGLSGEALYQAIYNQKAKDEARLNAVNTVRSAYGDGKIEDTTQQEQIMAQFNALNLQDQDGNTVKVTEWKDMADVIKYINIETSKLSGNITTYNEAIGEGTALLTRQAELKASQTQAEKDQKAAKWWNEIGVNIEKAKKGVDAYSAAINSIGELDVEALAQLQEFDPKALENYQTMSSTEWNEYAYKKAMEYYDQLASMYEKDSADYIAVMQQKTQATENYYKTIKEQQENAAQTILESWEKEEQLVNQAISSLQSLLNGDNLSETSFEAIEQLRKDLIEVGYTAEEVDAILRNLGKEETDEASIIEAAKLKTNLLLRNMGNAQEKSHAVNELVGSSATLSLDTKIDHTGLSDKGNGVYGAELITIPSTGEKTLILKTDTSKVTGMQNNGDGTYTVSYKLDGEPEQILTLSDNVNLKDLHKNDNDEVIVDYTVKGEGKEHSLLLSDNVNLDELKIDEKGKVNVTYTVDGENEQHQLELNENVNLNALKVNEEGNVEVNYTVNGENEQHKLELGENVNLTELKVDETGNVDVVYTVTGDNEQHTLKLDENVNLKKLQINKAGNVEVIYTVSGEDKQHKLELSENVTLQKLQMNKEGNVEVVYTVTGENQEHKLELGENVTLSKLKMNENGDVEVAFKLPDETTQTFTLSGGAEIEKAEYDSGTNTWKIKTSNGETITFNGELSGAGWSKQGDKYVYTTDGGMTIETTMVTAEGSEPLPPDGSTRSLIYKVHYQSDLGAIVQIRKDMVDAWNAEGQQDFLTLAGDTWYRNVDFSGQTKKLMEEYEGDIAAFAAATGKSQKEIGNNIASIGQAVNKAWEKLVNDANGDTQKALENALADKGFMYGYNLYAGLINGYQSAFGEYSGAVAAVSSELLLMIQTSLGEHSPSVYTQEMGRYLMEGLSIGFNEAEFKVSGLREKVLEPIRKELEAVQNDPAMQIEILRKAAGVTEDRDTYLKNKQYSVEQDGESYVIKQADKVIAQSIATKEAAVTEAYMRALSDDAATKTLEKQLESGVWGDQFSILQQHYLNEAANDSFKEINAKYDNKWKSVADLLKSGNQEAINAFYDAFSTNLNNLGDILSGDINIAWAQIKDTWVNTCNTLYGKEQEVAQKTYDLWVDTFNSIVAAREKIIKGEDWSGLSEQDRTNLYQSWLGEKNIDPQEIMRRTFSTDKEREKYLKFNPYYEAGNTPDSVYGFSVQRGADGFVSSIQNPEDAKAAQKEALTTHMQDFLKNLNDLTWQQAVDTLNNPEWAKEQAVSKNANAQEWLSKNTGKTWQDWLETEQGQQFDADFDLNKALAAAIASFEDTLIERAEDGTYTLKDDTQADTSAIQGDRDEMIAKVVAQTMKGWTDEGYQKYLANELAADANYLTQLRELNKSDYETRIQEQQGYSDILTEAIEAGGVQEFLRKYVEDPAQQREKWQELSEAYKATTGGNLTTNTSLNDLSTGAMNAANAVVQFSNALLWIIDKITSGYTSFETDDNGIVTASKTYGNITQEDDGSYTNSEGEAVILEDGQQFGEYDAKSKTLTVKITSDMVPGYLNQGTQNTEDYEEGMSSIANDGQESGSIQKRRNAVTSWKSYGLDPAEVDELGDSIQEMAESSDELSDSLRDNAEAADEVAKELKRFDNAVEAVKDNYKDWDKALKSNNIQKISKATKEMDKAFSDMLDIDYDSLSKDFLKNAENLELMKEAAEGSEEAYNKLRDAAEDDLLIQAGVKVDNTQAWDVINNLQDMIHNSIDDIEIQANINDVNAIAAMNRIINMAGMTAEQATNYLASMGVDAEVEQISVPETQTYAGAIANVEDVTFDWAMPAAAGGSGSGSVPSITYTQQPEPVDGTKMVTALRVTSAKKSSGGGFKMNNSSAGGSGKGGGGSKPQKKEKKKHKRTKDHVERYHENNEVLKRIGEELDKIDKLKSRAFGKNYVDHLNEETEALKDQRNAYQALKEEAEGYIQEDRDGLVNLGATFDAEGNINNYEELVENIVKEYNRAVDIYNNSAQNDGDKENLEEAEQAFDDAMKLIEDYEEALAQAAEAGIEMEDILNQISEIELEKITYELEVKLDLNERDIALLEYYQEKYENYLDKQDDIFNDFITKAAEYESNLGHLYNSYGQLIESYLGGDLLDAQYAEGLQDIQDQILENLSELNSIQNELADTYANTLSMATEEIEKLTGALDDNNSTLQSYMDIVNLLSVNGPDYKTMDYFYTKMNDNNLRNINIQKKHYDALLKEEDLFEQKLAERGELTELEQKEYEALQEEIRSARDTLTSTTQEAMELVQAQYENTINGIADSLFNFSEIGAYSLEHLQDQYGYFQEQQERYVSTAKALTEVSKLNRDIEGQLAQSVSASSKEALKALQEKINKQAELNKMTEYDIEMNQLQYQLLLARIKLEETENAKDVVRLTRDDNGNYAYQYTANQDKLDEAAQEYEDVLQQINDSTVQQTNEIEQKILNTMADYKEKLQEVALDYSLSEEERYARMQELSERFQETMYFLEDEYQTATSNLGENQAAMANHYGVSLESIMASTAGNVNSSIASMVSSMDEYVESVMSAFGADSDFNSAWATLQNNLQTIAQISGLTFGNMANDAEEMETEENRMIQQAEQLATTLTDTLKPINDLTTAWNNHYTALQNAITGYENLAIEIQDVLNTMSGFGNNTTNNSNNNPVPTAQVGGQHARGGLADYTGLAWLDGTKEDPELVLNPDDTHNMLKIVDSVRQLDPESIAMLMDSYKTNFASMYASLNSANISSIFQAQQSSDVLEQYVTITAEFPNASDRNEIKEVFDGLINRAAQFASRKK